MIDSLPRDMGGSGWGRGQLPPCPGLACPQRTSPSYHKLYNALDVCLMSGPLPLLIAPGRKTLAPPMPLDLVIQHTLLPLHCIFTSKKRSRYRRLEYTLWHHPSMHIVRQCHTLNIPILQPRVVLCTIVKHILATSYNFTTGS